MIGVNVDRQQADNASRLLEDTLRNRSKQAAVSSASANRAPGDTPAIRVTRRNDIQTQAAPADRFTGSAHVQRLVEPTAPARMSASSVTFEPGARTAWHIHPLGQTLIVTSGSGWFQQWGGNVREMREGEIVQIPAGVKHWHGATNVSRMTHLAIQEHDGGQTVEWLEKVTDAQYPSRERP